MPAAPEVFPLSAALDDAGRLLLLRQPQRLDAVRARLFSPTDGAALGPAYTPDRLATPTCGAAAWDGDS